jgi:hypothetical protein
MTFCILQHFYLSNHFQISLHLNFITNLIEDKTNINSVCLATNFQ